MVQHIAHQVEGQEKSAQVRHSDVSGESGSFVRMARSTRHEPNLIQNESGTTLLSVEATPTFMSVAVGEDDPMGV